MKQRTTERVEDAPLAAQMAQDRQVARLANVAIAGIILYVILDVIAQALPPHYNPISQAESDLAVGPYSIVMTLNFVIRGLLSASLLLALIRATARAGRSRAGLVLLGVWTAGAVLLAIFPTDLSGSRHTIHGAVHLLVALIAFVSVAAAEVLLSLRFAADPRLRSLQVPAALLAAITVLALLADLVAPVLLPNANVFGLCERVFLGLALLWMLVVALRLRSFPAIARTSVA